MMNANRKNGPIHFYPTEQRNEGIGNIVEYCVQIGERQPLTRSQACWLVSSGQVELDGKLLTDLSEPIAFGTWEVTIRGRKHHVIVHPAMFE